MKSRSLTDYVSETLTPLFWDRTAKEIAKHGAADIPGLVIQEKEFLSVRPSDKQERRQVTTIELLPPFHSQYTAENTDQAYWKCGDSLL